MVIKTLITPYQEVSDKVLAGSLACGRPARARALPDTAVAVSACGLAVWSFTYIYMTSLLLHITNI